MISETSTSSCGSYGNTFTFYSHNGGSGHTTGWVHVHCPPPPPNLAITARSPTRPRWPPGSQLGFTVTLQNSGGGTATGLAFTDALPAGSRRRLDARRPRQRRRLAVSGAPPNQTLVYNPNSLSAGAATHAHVVSTTTVNSCGSYDNDPSFTSDDGGSGSASSTADVFCGLLRPRLPATSAAAAAASPATSAPATSAAAATSAPAHLRERGARRRRRRVLAAGRDGGTVAADSSGYGTPGPSQHSRSASPARSAHDANTAARFNGVAAGHRRRSDAALRLNGSLTIEFWAPPDLVRAHEARASWARAMATPRTRTRLRRANGQLWLRRNNKLDRLRRRRARLELPATSPSPTTGRRVRWYMNGALATTSAIVLPERAAATEAPDRQGAGRRQRRRRRGRALPERPQRGPDRGALRGRLVMLKRALPRRR